MLSTAPGKTNYFFVSVPSFYKSIVKVMKCSLGFCFSLWILSFVFSAKGAKIQLYKDKDYSDLQLEVYPTEACYNVPSDKKVLFYSIITDTCFIAYHSTNCKASWSSKFMPGKIIPTDITNGWWAYIASIQICNEEDGGPQLNIDITTHLINADPPNTPNILESFYDVCTCLNLPNYVQNMSKWSIDNHGNGLFAYFEPNCAETKSKGLYIHAGHWKNSRDMHTHTRIYRGDTLKIQSLGPAQNCTYFKASCSVYSKDKIMKLELLQSSLNNSYPMVTTGLTETQTDMTTVDYDDVINFFADNNYQGFHFGSRSTLKCNNFSKLVERHWINGTGSIKTSACVILYLKTNCQGRSVKIEAPGSTNLTNVWESTVTGVETLSLLYTQYPNWKWETKSYHVCNKDEGGSTLNVDIVSSDPDAEPNPLDGPVVLESYSNVCSCRKIPEYVQQLEKWSVRNHGNEMVAYFSTNCSSSMFSPLWIPAGESSYSFGLGSFKIVDQSTGITHKIQSFGPDPNSDYFQKSCNKNCTKMSLTNNEGESRLIANNVCDFDDKSECTQVGLFNTEQIQALISEFHRMSNNLENIKHEFDDKLEKQKSEIQELTDMLNSHNHEE